VTTTQTCAYASTCPGGESCAAPVPRFIDNGNTVTDRRTCLVWEKKTGTFGTPNPSDPHDVNNTYTWSTGSPWNFDGTASSEFLAPVNAAAFAGYNSWRLPWVDELEGILSALYPGCTSSPCIDPIFGPTAPTPDYWTFGTDVILRPLTGRDFSHAFGVGFGDGRSNSGMKWQGGAVRAVRYGP
jgi:hypothetical protein